MRKISRSELFELCMDWVILLICPVIMIAVALAFAVVVTFFYWLAVIVIVEVANIINLLTT